MIERLAGLYGREQYAAVVDETACLMQGDWPPYTDAIEMAQYYYFGAMARFRLDDVAGAAQWVCKALEEVNVSGDWLWIGRIRFQASEVYRRAGDTALALDNGQAFLNDLARYPEHRSYEAAAHYNLGLICRQRREYDAAIAHYRQAERLSRAAGNNAVLCRTLENLAWAYCDLDRFDETWELLPEIQTLVAELDDRTLRITAIYTEARLLAHDGQPQEAMRLCREVLTDGAGATLAQQALATWIAAESALAMGRYDEAQELLAMADAAAVQAADPRPMGYIQGLRTRMRGILPT